MNPESERHQDAVVLRQALPRRTVAGVRLSRLTIPGDPDRGAAEVRDVELSVTVGSLAVLSPACAGRSVLLYLAGSITGTRAAPEQVRSAPPPVVCRIASAVPSGSRAGDLDDPSAARTARLLGIESDTPDPAHSDPVDAVLAGIVEALAEPSDILAIEEPLHDLAEDQSLRLAQAARELVDTQGRTVLMVGDVDRMSDRIVDLFDEFYTLRTT
ncbi:hypothetical protein ACMYYO_00160 [Dermacoccaceae bacterium W4C1]